MKSWILPTLAVGAVVFLMTRPGKDLQEQVSEHCSDWADNLARSARRLQQSLQQVQTVVERVGRTLEAVS